MWVLINVYYVKILMPLAELLHVLPWAYLQIFSKVSLDIILRWIPDYFEAR